MGRGIAEDADLTFVRDGYDIGHNSPEQAHETGRTVSFPALAFIHHQLLNSGRLGTGGFIPLADTLEDL